MTHASRRLGALVLAYVGIVSVADACARGGGGDETTVVTDVAVHTGVVVARDMHRFVTAYGYVEPAPARDGRAAAGALLTPLAPGVVTEILTVEGARVSKGAVLIRLDTRLADVAVQRAEQELAFAKGVAERQRLLLPSEGTSQRLLQEAEQRLNDARSSLASARTSRSYLEVAAPISGTVTGLSARVGQAIDATTVLGRVVDLGRIVVTADVPVNEAQGLAIGGHVELGSDSAGARGVVSIIGKDVDPQTGTARVTISLAAGSGLAPGQFTDLRILAASHPGVLVVPDEAVVSSSAQGSWILVVSHDAATRMPVTVGIREGGMTEVSAPGLASGMSVVTVEAYSLPERTNVHVAGR